MKNIYGGGAKTNENGLKFEQETNLIDLLQKKDFKIEDMKKGKKSLYKKCFSKDNKVELISCPKHQLYKYLDNHYLDSEKINSKKWLPDEALINEKKKKVFIIEKKFQNTAGSVDEKLPNCEFKRQEYQKLFQNDKINYDVNFIYIFNDWFKKDEYKDVLNYIDSKENCSYYFNEIPLETFL